MKEQSGAPYLKPTASKRIKRAPRTGNENGEWGRGQWKVKSKDQLLLQLISFLMVKDGGEDIQRISGEDGYLVPALKVAFTWFKSRIYPKIPGFLWQDGG